MITLDQSIKQKIYSWHAEVATPLSVINVLKTLLVTGLGRGGDMNGQMLGQDLKRLVCVRSQ